MPKSRRRRRLPLRLRRLVRRRLRLLKSNSVDPDMLDERARSLLDYVDTRDLILIQKKP